MNQEEDTDIVTRVCAQLDLRTLRPNIKLEQTGSGSGSVFEDIMYGLLGRKHNKRL